MYDLAEAAQRSGFPVDELSRLVELGIVTPNADGEFGASQLRRANLVRSLMAAGIPLDGLGAAIRSGHVSLDFLDASAFDRFSVVSGSTFAEAARRTGVPLEFLLFIREAAGGAIPSPEDRVREEEVPIVELMDTALRGGIRPGASSR